MVQNETRGNQVKFRVATQLAKRIPCSSGTLRNAFLSHLLLAAGRSRNHSFQTDRTPAISFYSR